ncbi:hypothetical protein QYE76_025004 [Lolium multiflorum]|uniref:Peptidase M48 domain-containing protein n=1 Tax=Lolium multiflorum TaxID=4521 RepID=A0AAD8VTS5_LOLMU|nr:hypothetical protein QYE76_025004 [Lolium multiflorum]
MNCLKNLVSGLRGRCSSAVRPPLRPPAPTTRCYSASTRRSHEVLQSGRGRLFRRNPVVVCRPPPSHALVFPRHYSSRRTPSDIEILFRVLVAGGAIVYGVVATIRDGTFEIVPYTNRSHLIIYTPEQERELGESYFANLKKELGKKILPPSHPDSVRVRGLAKEILRAAHRGLADASDAAANQRNKSRQPQTKHLDGINWEVLVVKDNAVNAFCTPGGKIVVYTGLLDRFKTDAEIATVLGHEVGHVIARHSIEKLTKNMWITILNLVLLLLVFDAPKGHTNDELMKFFFAKDELMKLLLSLPFSRKYVHIGLCCFCIAHSSGIPA